MHTSSPWVRVARRKPQKYHHTPGHSGLPFRFIRHRQSSHKASPFTPDPASTLAEAERSQPRPLTKGLRCDDTRRLTMAQGGGSTRRPSTKHWKTMRFRLYLRCKKLEYWLRYGDRLMCLIRYSYTDTKQRRRETTRWETQTFPRYAI
jgi:hypothetical protein